MIKKTASILLAALVCAMAAGCVSTNSSPAAAAAALCAAQINGSLATVAVHLANAQSPV
jgi:hypothetical protein